VTLRSPAAVTPSRPTPTLESLRPERIWHASLVDLVEGVIGVDTHRDSLAAAAIDHLRGLLGETTVGANAEGYRHVLGLLPGAISAGSDCGPWKARAATAPA
jgi:hypothetical protein